MLGQELELLTRAGKSEDGSGEGREEEGTGAAGKKALVVDAGVPSQVRLEGHLITIHPCYSLHVVVICSRGFLVIDLIS